MSMNKNKDKLQVKLHSALNKNSVIDNFVSFLQKEVLSKPISAYISNVNMTSFFLVQNNISGLHMACKKTIIWFKKY